MNFAQRRIALPAAVLLGAAFTPAIAQRPPSPEQRIATLQQQVSASQATALRLEQKIDSLERQVQQLINQGELNGHRASELESALAKLRGDMDSRLTALESRPAAEQSAESAPAAANPAPKSASAVEAPVKAVPVKAVPVESESAAASDPAEEAYSEGFRLWRDGKYDQSITALRAFVSGFPKHRRVSFARNLIGRALLDKGQPRPAAEALLANYRADPKGERAPDSLYYLGQALMELKQPGQACKAYAELDDVYGASVRADLKSLVTKAKTDASCS